MDIYSLDIGGSSIKHGIVRVEGASCEIIERMQTLQLDTNSFSELKNQVIAAVSTRAQLSGQKVDVAISTTGGVSRSGLVWNAGHFDGYRNIEWQKLLQTEIPQFVGKVVTTNDGKASAWAEYHRTGLGSEIFVHFVVGSGIGGGIICFDKLLYGDGESAGALGHMKVSTEGEVVCSCRHTGCVETFASSQAIARYFSKFAKKGKKVFTETPSFTDTFEAAQAGDDDALRAFELAGEWLGVAISNVINILNPKYISVGGGVILASIELSSINGGPYLDSAIRRANKLAFEDVAAETTIMPASAGNDGGLLGAAVLAVSSIVQNS